MIEEVLVLKWLAEPTLTAEQDGTQQTRFPFTNHSASRYQLLKRSYLEMAELLEITFESQEFQHTK